MAVTKDCYTIKEQPPVAKQQDDTYRNGLVDKKVFLEEIYKRYGRKLFSYAVHSWKLEEDNAWDLIYKTLDKVVASYENYTFETENKFASFIFKIFVNYLRNDYQAKKNIPESVSLEDKHATVTQPGEKERPKTNHKLVALTEELEKMEDWQRMLLLMRSEGWPYSDIAKFVNKPENQLKVYYQRLKEQLSKKLHERF